MRMTAPDPDGGQDLITHARATGLSALTAHVLDNMVGTNPG